MAENSPQITGKTIALLVTDGVELPELTEPIAAIKAAGGTAKIISPNQKSLQAMEGDWNHSDHFDVDVQLSSASAGDYDGLVLPGGTLNADSLRIDEDAKTFVSAFFAAEKPVAAICHGSWILTDIQQVKGRRVTSYPSLKTDLTNAGAEWVDESAVVSNGLVTSRTPDDLDDFNQAFLTLVAQA
ncbi:type 1 glutamine amidotransferase [Nesterenkonia sp. E16_7]|uniref:type 1 glutamine amidotransferase domain-containing protein n=1 Tax=unclassified Nesterenkonia TaxID=2629769 RepID=UPI001A92665A|nr:MULTISPECIES: type 1 glutamine amidotransferase domain-containing protein [unclassified Nesterenkonia]MBO0595519.1 type 1 glutamine amidotransferase [Nesterenkonia sp. E16_10]MBO0599035.1 type 1 glutamine amidotransferase [Nesterenkonia sp. E16_7]